MEAHPLSIQRCEDGGLEITWSDDSRRRYNATKLRENCPCATCREKQRLPQEEKPLSLPIVSGDNPGPLSITAMKPLGSYAYGIAFSDGHDTGIYQLEMLYRLGEELSSGASNDG